MAPDERNTSSSAAGSGRTDSSAYASEEQVREAAKQYGQRNTRLGQRQKILASLRESGVMAAMSVPDLLDAYERQDETAQHSILDFLLHLAGQGAELASHADGIAKHLNDANFALRDKVLAILLRMGPKAAGAEMCALGCTRHSMKEIRVAGIRVLGAIGPACSATAINRLQSMLKTTPDAEVEFCGLLTETIAAVRRAGAVPVPAAAMLPADDPSGTQVVQIVEELARQAAGGGTARLRQLSIIPTGMRIQGLLSCLNLPDPRARGIAARLLQDYIHEVTSVAPGLAQIYRRETDMYARGHIADLLTCILCEQTLVQ